MPGYLSKLGIVAPLPEGTLAALKWLGDATLVATLAVGGVTIVIALVKGMAEHRERIAVHAAPLADLED